MSHLYSIRVGAEAQTQEWVALLPILEDLLPVTFCFSRDRTPETAGEMLTRDAVVVERGMGGGVSSFEMPHDATVSRGGGLIPIDVQFSDEPGVPFPYRGRSLRTNVLAPPNIFALRAGERSLATCDLGPVWTCSERAGVKHFRSAFALPVVQAHAGLQDVLGGHCFLEMLPLLCWLREICASVSFDGPPTRACFIFDDPNLHWPSYGFVNYRKIATQAERENYHVSFATIPLDTWFTHRETGAIFRDHPDRLSLAVHGNNHTKQELGRAYSEIGRVFLLRQAIQRIERLESHTGLVVSRVMVPPHGACSEEMLAALPHHGFEAASISHGSLRAHNRNRTWTKNLGFLPSELIRGCPVLPRWGLTGDLTNTILLAAFLKQAIILRGHHQDLRDGIELLDDLAKFINGLGTVTWSNLTHLMRSNFQWRTAGMSFQLKPLGRKLTCSLPKEVRRFSVGSFGSTSPENWKIQGANGSTLDASAGEIVSLPAPTHGSVSIEIATDTPASAAKVSERTPPLALVRRFLTESRDRLSSL